MQSIKRKSIIREMKDGYQLRRKKRKRKKFFLKAKLMLTVILPVFIILLSVKAVKAFIQIKVRSLFAGPEETACEKAAPSKPPVPVKKEPVEKELIHPAPMAAASAAEEAATPGKKELV